ncbi:unnamed protein product [Calypogeia fissa]
MDDILSTWVQPMLEDVRAAISFGIVSSVPKFLIATKRQCEQRYLRKKLIELDGVDIAQSRVQFRNQLERLAPGAALLQKQQKSVLAQLFPQVLHPEYPFNEHPARITDYYLPEDGSYVALGQRPLAHI